MQSTYERKISEATKIERNILQGDEKLFVSPFGDACKGIWKHKTAETLAARLNITVRAAQYQLNGQSDPSAKSIALLAAIMAGREPR